MAAYRDVTGRYRTHRTAPRTGAASAPGAGTAEAAPGVNVQANQAAKAVANLGNSQSSAAQGTRWQSAWSWAVLLTVSATSVLNFSGCQTDQTAQVKINQMRAELLAIEGRYAALRHDYEKVRRRLAAQGDPLSDGTSQPSALPLVYPPGDTPLDQMPSSDIWSEPLHPDQVHPESGMPMPANEDTSAPTPSVLENVNFSGSSAHNAPALTIAPPRSIPVQLLVDPQQSGGIDRDQQPGDEGVRIVVQPLDAQGRLVLQAGEFELRLLDYSREEGAELGHWRFSKVMIQKFLQTRSQRSGIPLQVTLRRQIPSNTELLAEVRMLLPNGQTLEHRELVQVQSGNLNVRNSTAPFSLDGMSFPQGTAGLADFGNSSNSVSEPVIPSYLPGDGGVTSPVSPPAAANGSAADATAAVPGWSPTRQ